MTTKPDWNTGDRFGDLPIRHVEDRDHYRVGEMTVRKLRERLPDDVLVPLIRLMVVADRLRALAPLLLRSDGRRHVEESRARDAAMWLNTVALAGLHAAVGDGAGGLRRMLQGAPEESDLRTLLEMASRWEKRTRMRRLRDKAGKEASQQTVLAGLDALMEDPTRFALIEVDDEDIRDLWYPLAESVLLCGMWSDALGSDPDTMSRSREEVNQLAHDSARAVLLIPFVVKGVVRQSSGGEQAGNSA